MIRRLLTCHISDHLFRLTVTEVVPVRHYPRRRQLLPPPSYLQMNDEGDVLDESEIDTHLDIMEDQLHVENSDKSREKAKRQWLKNKIIEKKYFKQPPEVNLLSWNAKEQIRYLHAKDPDEWTVAKLAQSFPVTEEGIVKILQSSYNPLTQQEIDKYDVRVRKNWLALRSYMRQHDPAVIQVEGGPVAHTVQKLVDSAKLPLMINAGGMNNVKLPQTIQRNYERKKVGVFEAIVKDYVENENRNQQDKEKIPLSLDECQPLLRDISNFRHIHSENLSKKIIMKKKASGNMQEKDGGKGGAVSRRGRRLVESLKKGTLGSSLLVDSNMTELGMQGTGRTRDTHKFKETSHHEDRTNIDNESHFTMSDNLRTRQKKENMRFESQRRTSHSVPEKDAYRSNTDWVNPLEQSDKELDRLEVPESLKHKGDLYQRGNCVYDEDGEFLFKIP